MQRFASTVSRVSRTLSFAAVVLAAASCGGGDGGSTNPPGVVARVDVTAPTTSVQVGQTLQVTARYYDASSAQLSGKSITYSTSSSAVATVSETGLVTTSSPGSVSIVATVDGIQGSLPITVTDVPVAFIAITPTSPSVRQSESITLTAEPRSASGQPLPGRVVTWSSSSEARATVTQGGVVTGVTTGNVFIRAAVDTRVDSVNLRVRNLLTPTITGTSSSTLVPGGTGSLTGTNFGATIADNQVLVNGIPAAITSATATAITFTVPARSQLPCTATGPVPVALVAAGDTAFATVFLRVGTERSLGVGEYLLLTNADLECNEFTGTGGTYLITAFNYATHAGVRTSFRLTGSAPSVATAAAGMKVGPPLRETTSRIALPDDPESRHLRAHASFRQLDGEMARRLGNPRLAERRKLKASTGSAARVAAAVVPPQVGETRTYRMRRTLASSSTWDEVSFRIVYSGSKLVIGEDVTAPLAGTMDAEYVKLGEEFDQVMYDQLLFFGDPLVADAALDDNGRMLALFSPKVNGYEINGVSNIVLGFVTLCDFFPREAVTLPDGTVIPPCASSNEGEAFYALVPDPAAGWSISFWRRLMRGTLVHEVKHVASYAWRYHNDASVLEETWLEEATAQQASEIWARSVYQRGWKQDLGWADGPLCDYAPAGGGCPDPAEGVLHHFGFLYTHYESLESKSILDDPFSTVDPVVYGSSWSFIRYVTDAFAESEPDFLGSIIQVQNDRGVQNVVSKSGRPFSELLGMFSIASVADNYPNANLTDPKLRLASWNSRDLFANMSANLVDGSGSQAYPLEWPLRARQVSFGNFNTGQSEVSQLRGGGFAAWELSGTQSGPQALAIRSVSGGVAPPQIGMTILRVQ